MNTRNIGKNRGARRIWLERNELLNNGITHGMRFDVVAGINVLEITINPDGKRKVSGTAKRPIIDMAGNIIEQSFAWHCNKFVVAKTDTGIKLEGVSDNGIKLEAV